MSWRPHPWQAQTWARVAAQRDRLPHALLLSGVPGLGKRDFAIALAAALLCEAPGPEGTACGGCGACRLVAAASHPDLLALVPEARARERDDPLARHAARFFEPRQDSRRKPPEGIVIHQVRALIAACQSHPHSAQRQVAVIEPADLMNANAANSLLKLLEEPPGDTLFLLVSARPGALPATVRSRCTRLVFRPPPAAQALAWLREQDPALDWTGWLALAGGAPLAARALADPRLAEARGRMLADFLQLALGRGDPVAAAGRWLDSAGITTALDWLQHWVQDLLRLALAGAPPRLANPDQRDPLAELAGRIAVRPLLHYDEALCEARGLLADGVLDARLVLEDLLARLYVLGRRT